MQLQIKTNPAEFNPEIDIILTKEFFSQLYKDSIWLEYLNAAGVDNWDGYSEAYAMMMEDEKTGEQETIFGKEK